MEKSQRIIVIGGGIVGLAIAEKLCAEGKDVTLIEKETIAAGASQGNAAGLAFSDIMPLASPGILKKAIKWFLDPLGPFAVVAQDLPHTFGWLLRFLKAARPAQFKKSIDVQAALMHLAKDTFPEMLERSNLSSMVRTNGALHLYETMASYQTDLEKWQFRKEHNIAFQTYEGDALHSFQPGLSPSFVAGIFASEWQSVSNPLDFCQALHKHLNEKGVETVYGEVSNLADGLVTLKNGDQLSADKIILAAGPWSSKLSSKLGDPVPLIGERGYNTTLPKTAFDGLDHTLVFSDHGFVVVPLSDGVRIGGASEIAKLDRAANYKRCKAMMTKATRLLPELKTNDGVEWMGARPAVPDTLPVISYASRSKNIIYTFGHGHLGLTQSSATAQLVCELVDNQETSIDITALRVNRF
ncbi:FAD-binding oxidoreductase [Terasakiella sp. A23]|uniref:NAD(P)/FAD-dependent oxidoreductase n=1 Tax=Terasakiella sp. FCG-A23 TaxID=3080561 RepID=UPI002955D8FC|nr:FAD-binding oxidoreductase [Terasakiella sp. A23]MDV7341241.1 FAD-binding oxidoreductase [Terasakiella sp. A23]